MNGTLRAAGERLTAAARAVCAAFPNADAMRAVAVGKRPNGDTPANLAAALGFLWDELELVRHGLSTDLTVLEDELAGVERLLASTG